MNTRYRDLAHFSQEVLRGQCGPMSSAAEDIADEMYQQDFSDEFDSMWDAMDED